jgi:hypothetical protein
LQWVEIGFWHGADVDIEQLIVSRAELARVFGLSGSRITELVEERVIPAPESSRQVQAGGQRARLLPVFTRHRRRAIEGRCWFCSRAGAVDAIEGSPGGDWGAGGQLGIIPVATMIQGWEAISAVLRTRYLGVPNIGISSDQTGSFFSKPEPNE